MSLGYEELNEDQKKQARDWWYDLERQDPGLLDEMRASKKAALMAFKDGLTPVILAQFDEAKITGWCFDCILADLWREYNGQLTTDRIRNGYSKAWRAEMKSRKDREYIEECLLANGYQFELKVVPA